MSTLSGHSWKNTGNLKTGLASAADVSDSTDTDWRVPVVVVYGHAHVCVRMYVSMHEWTSTCGGIHVCASPCTQPRI